ncbi:MAG: DUF3536 domain-containing protein [Deltaproteobacteria bacterium]|nr:DUF3536 domain-containing protein [Deltaproteobacteria bacterium]
MSSPRYLIIHGHFYQPPRENPWSGVIPNQPTATPFPNWNVRINRECYAPNTCARILDNQGSIDKIINNFRYLSFNVGPTLLAWLKDSDPIIYQAIVEADRLAASERGGHGPALAQVFNHMIMPLSNFRDKKTQIIWGRKHFQKTYGRDPEGMWLAETAVDLETLKLLKENGLKFTILAQNQVLAIRPLGQKKPFLALTEPPDPREPYRVFWGENPDDYLDVFIYDGPVSRAVAFENLLRDGKTFLDRVKQAFGAPLKDDRPILVNLATDGESYGHHFHFGEMALAWLFHNVLNTTGQEEICLTNYAEFLSLYPPRLEAQLIENSSWSCAHGVERWRADCGCHTGGDPSWNQKWRAPLRDGLNWLRDELIEILEREGSKYFHDPWAARDAYIDVILDDYLPETQTHFLQTHGKEAAQTHIGHERALEFMETQLMSLYMFTSCGWFFDDLAGLEPIQNLRYAARAIELSQRHSPKDLEAGLLEYLQTAKPNNQLYITGANLWESEVEGMGMNSNQLTAQWSAAVAMDTPQALDPYRYIEVSNSKIDKVFRQPEDPLPHFLTGQASFTERRLGITFDRYTLVLADEGPKLDILVLTPAGDKLPEFQRAKTIFLEKGPAFLRSILNTLFPDANTFTLESLWPHVRSEILTGQLKGFFEELRDYTARAFRNYHEALRQYSLKENAWNWMDRFVFRIMAEVDLENILKPMRDGRPIDLKYLRELISQESGGSSRNIPVIKESCGIYIKKLFSQLRDGPRRPTLIEELLNFLKLIKSILKDVDYWESQNLYFQLIGNEESFFRSMGDSDREQLTEIGLTLGFSKSFIQQSLI